MDSEFMMMPPPDGEEIAMTVAAPIPANSKLDGLLNVLDVIRRPVFVLAILFCLSPWASAPVALALGMALALTVGTPWRATAHKTAKIMLQICVVLLGFTMNLHTVLSAGAQGALMAAASIGITYLAGWLLGRWLKIDPQTSWLIASGTAICGGSAIAAVATVLDAGESQMTVAMGTVFLLNAVALYLFVPIGHALGLTQYQFGVWAGISIHDISSVVAAASRYGPSALTTATAVKLSRALWIVPVSMIFGIFSGRIARSEPAGLNEELTETPASGGQARKPKIHVPWFIGLFLLASLSRSFLPAIDHAAPDIGRISALGLTITLFLIGAGLSRATLKKVGIRPMIQGVLLWMLIGGGTLLLILLHR
jgi:uncharacterized integral membrane protein (TIGR00698 family)